MISLRLALRSFKTRLLVGALLSLSAWGSVQAEGSAVVLLGFDVQTLTTLAVSPEDHQQARDMSDRLLGELQQITGLSITLLPVDEQTDSNIDADGVFDQPAIAGALGRASQADWLISGRLVKDEAPTIFLRAQLIEVDVDRIAADFVVEADGDEPTSIDNGIEALAGQINDTLRSLDVIP